MYCQIFKAGSTDINRLFDFMSTYDRYKSPFNITWADLTNRQKHPTVRSISEFNKQFMDSFKVLFVRDPYKRIFSGYLDKIFFPNVYYWKVLGTHILRNHRLDTTERASRCGHDVSFHELVKYIIAGHSVDEHFTSYYESCSPCKIQYDFIGKIETSRDDLEIIWKHLNNSSKPKIPFPEIEKPSDLDNLNGHAGSIFGSKVQLSNCMSFYDAMKRAWLALQMRGILGCNVTMPINEDEAQTMTIDEFKSITRRAYQESGSKEFRSQCKSQALMKAYRSLPMADLQKLKQVLKSDCTLFGYDNMPSYIFNRTDMQINSTRYFDGL